MVDFLNCWLFGFEREANVGNGFVLLAEIDLVREQVFQWVVCELFAELAGLLDLRGLNWNWVTASSSMSSSESWFAPRMASLITP
jgi:hypothetical protein